MDDASLDEFLDDSASDGDDEREADAGDGVEDDPEVTPTVSTYEFSPDGAPCASCADEVVRRWRDDGVLVCRDCKQWGD